MITSVALFSDDTINVVRIQVRFDAVVFHSNYYENRKVQHLFVCLIQISIKLSQNSVSLRIFYRRLLDEPMRAFLKRKKKQTFSFSSSCSASIFHLLTYI